MCAPLCACFVDDGQMTSQTGSTSDATTGDESSTTDPCPVGSQGCGCVANSCLDGLVCQGEVCIVPICGNGILEGVERCDDGDTVNGNGCNIDCEISGSLQWQMFANGAANANDYGAEVAVDAQQNVHINGILRVGSGNPSRWYASMRPDKSGLKSGNDQFPTNFVTDLSGLAVAGADLIDIGTRSTGSDGKNMWIRRRSATEELWSRGFDGIGEEDGGLDVAVDSTGHIVAVGFETTDLGRNVLLVKLDPEGASVWRQTYNHSGTLDDEGHGVAIAADDDIVVAGTVGFASDDQNAWVARYNSDGNLLWLRTFAGPAGVDDSAEAVVVDPADHVIVTGFLGIDGMLQSTMWLARLAPDGVPVWELEDTQSGVFAAGTDVALDSTGALAVVGVALSEEQGLDVLVRKYTASGELMWEDIRHSTEANWDAAHGVAIDAEDSIYVVGTMWAPEQGGNIWLAKYNP